MPTSLTTFLNKFRGAGGAAMPRPPLRLILLAGLGGALALATVALLAQSMHLPWILGSFGATCVLVFGFPDAPFSQPRAVIGGHVVASAIGVAVVGLLGSTWWTIALAGSLAIMAMLALRIVHPPAGSNPVIAVVGLAHWDFILLPTLLGAVVITLLALFYLNATRTAAYPQRW